MAYVRQLESGASHEQYNQFKRFQEREVGNVKRYE